MSNNSPFAVLPPSQLDDILRTAQECRQDTRPNKIDVVIGAYRDAQGKPYVLPSVIEAERRLFSQLEKRTRNKEYEPVDGFQPFCEAACKMLLGPEMPPSDQIAKFAVLSGTGAVRVATSVYAAVASKDVVVYCSKETWPNHESVCKQSGLPRYKSYRYFDPRTCGVDYNGMMEDLNEAKPGSIVIVHGAGHNPTGADLTEEQWEAFASMAKARSWFVILDSAYQGYASGDIDRDAYGARCLARKRVWLAACQSFAKNMGLYGDRCGALSILTYDRAMADRVAAYARAWVIRPMYSSPPIIGFRIAHLLLTDPVLRPQWETELRGLSERIKAMRQAVFEELTRLKTPGDWTHIVRQIGMFSYVGITEEQVRYVRDKHAVFMLPSSRISVAGLTSESAIRFARAIDDAVRNVPKGGRSKL